MAKRNRFPHSEWPSSGKPARVQAATAAFVTPFVARGKEYAYAAQLLAVWLPPYIAHSAGPFDIYRSIGYATDEPVLVTNEYNFATPSITGESTRVTE